MTALRLAQPVDTTDSGAPLVKAGWAGVALVVLVSSALSTLGADLLWAARLGGADLTGASVGVPFAAAPTRGWPNPLVVGQVLLHASTVSAGLRGLLIAQTICVAACFGFLAQDARRAGARGPAVTVVAVLAATGTLTSLAIARVQMFSLPLFPLLLLLLRAQHRRPDRRVWLLLPLLAIWSNLHGAVLVGLGVSGMYLLLSRLRLRPVETVLVGIASLLASCLTPALWRTPRYELGLLVNQAVRQGDGVWAHPSLGSPFDLAAVAAVALLGSWAWRSRPPGWEVATGSLLALGFVSATRIGLWLLLFMVVPAACGVRTPLPGWLTGGPRGTAVSLIVGAVLLALHRPAIDPVVRQAVSWAGPTGVLVAQDALGEQAAYAGGRLWVVNPLDAFSAAEQRSYLDWAAGRAAGDGELAHASCVVLVSPASAAAQRMASRGDWRLAAADHRAQAWVRTSCGGGT